MQTIQYTNREIGEEHWRCGFYMNKILIKNGRIWMGEEFFYGDVLTDGECIAQIAPEINEEADYVFWADGMIVSPGLIDTHVHVKGISPKIFGMNVEMASFPFGVTAINEAGCVTGDEELLAHVGVKHTVFVTAAIKDNHMDIEETEKLLGCYMEKVIGLKVYFDTTVSEVTDITPLREICEYARKRNLKVMVHCSNSPTTMREIVDTLGRGDIITHIYHGEPHSCVEDEFECIKVAKEKGVVIDA